MNLIQLLPSCLRHSVGNLQSECPMGNPQCPVGNPQCPVGNPQSQRPVAHSRTGQTLDRCQKIHRRVTRCRHRQFLFSTVTELKSAHAFSCNSLTLKTHPFWR